ncbi:hypothetical protein J2793_006741 [Paraburkholderia caledonica]|uniref:Uncharacterized protein n=1 Tax=Paraburkholderia caledonica TaxID=134536 RepID=A0AB73INL7_9BURK|nr:hypothetical protein [Paraburkholderia caledonica]
MSDILEGPKRYITQEGADGSRGMQSARKPELRWAWGPKSDHYDWMDAHIVSGELVNGGDEPLFD